MKQYNFRLTTCNENGKYGRDVFTGITSVYATDCLDIMDITTKLGMGYLDDENLEVRYYNPKTKTYEPYSMDNHMMNMIKQDLTKELINLSLWKNDKMLMNIFILQKR